LIDPRNHNIPSHQHLQKANPFADVRNPSKVQQKVAKDAKASRETLARLTFLFFAIIASFCLKQDDVSNRVEPMLTGALTRPLTLLLTATCFILFHICFTRHETEHLSFATKRLVLIQIAKDRPILNDLRPFRRREIFFLLKHDLRAISQ
jgi:hypothetical protein